MRVRVLAIVMLVSACAPVTTAPSASTPSAFASPTPMEPFLPNETPVALASPSPMVEPPAPYVAPPPDDPRLPPTVKGNPGVFPILTTYHTKLPVVYERHATLARLSV